MEENTQLPKDSIIPADKIAFMNEAIEKLRKANRSDYESGDFDAYNHTNAGRYKAFEEVLQWVNPVASYEEKIKVLEYDNNRLKGEVEGLKSAVEELRGRVMRHAIAFANWLLPSGCIANEKDYELFLMKPEAVLDESAAGREDDNKAQFDALQNWLSEGGYSFDGEYYYDDENNFFTPDQIWEKFKQQKEK